MTSWRSGYAGDCKSLNPSSILGDVSNRSHILGLNMVGERLKAPHRNVK